MKMDAKKTAEVIGTCLKYGKHNAVTRNALENAKRLLEEHEELREKILMHIANYQLAISPTGFEGQEDCQYRRGQWQGLQDAFEIILEDWEA